MNAVATVFLLMNAVALVVLPRRWVALPLLLGACYMTLDQQIELGAFHFPVIRLLIGVALLRAVTSGEGLAGGFRALDGWMLAWAIWALLDVTFHDDPSATLVNRLGLVYNACGIFFALRVFTRSIDDVAHLCRIAAVVLIPLALAMAVEGSSGRNPFAALGGVQEISEMRGERVRAQGPFLHPILAGSVAATALPLMLAIFRRAPWTSILGTAACLTIVMASGSSGPLLSTLVALVGVAAWKVRGWLGALRWLAVLVYAGLEVAMKAPAYFLLARVDLTGGSTGWHRAALIDAAIEHLPEWWLTGTDYTRHWMTYGVGWSPSHIDVTNYYIMMGVLGGLPLMALFIAVIVRGFRDIGGFLKGRSDDVEDGSHFLVWSLGAALFAHAATLMSVSYFDQSVVFFYLTLAAIGTCCALPVAEADAVPAGAAEPALPGGTRSPVEPTMTA